MTTDRTLQAYVMDREAQYLDTAYADAWADYMSELAAEDEDLWDEFAERVELYDLEKIGSGD